VPGSGIADDPFDLVTGAHRHGRLGNNHRIARQMFADFARDFIDEGKVGMAIAAAAGGAHCDENGAGALYAFGKAGGEGQAPRLHIGFDQRFKARFIDRHDPGVQPVNLALILVDADHVMSEIGKTRPRYEPDIARTRR